MRFAVLVCLLLAVVPAAHAGWDGGVSLAGTPYDVEAWAPGLYSVATTLGGAYAGTGDSVVSLHSGSSVGTYRFQQGCFASFRPTGIVTDNCVPPVHIVSRIYPDNTASLKRVKHTAADRAYAIATVSTTPGESQLLYSGGDAGVQRPWERLKPLPTSGGPTEALGVLSMGSEDHALFATQSSLFWYRNSSLAGQYGILDQGKVVVPNAIELFAGDGGTPTALIGTPRGLYRGTLGASVGDAGPFSRVPLPGGDLASVVDVEVNTGAGGELGDGFGVALVQRSDGGVVLLSAVPSPEPEQVGTLWRVNDKFAPLPSSPDGGDVLRRVACHGAEFCVLVLNKFNMNNLLLYTNAHAPVLDLKPVVPVAGEARGVFAIRATDEDGDAVRVSVEPSFVDTGLVQMSWDGGGGIGGVDLQMQTGHTCTPTLVQLPLRIFATDGLARHEVDAGLTVEVGASYRPERPRVTPSEAALQAGDDGSSFTVDATASACPVQGYDWKASTPGAPALEMEGGTTAFVRIPATVCVKDVKSYEYQVTAFNAGGFRSDPAPFTLQVRPWGTPLPAFKEGAQVLISEAQGQYVEPQAEHACTGAPGFPGVETTWNLESGDLSSVEGIRLRDENGNLVTALPATTSRLAVEADDCVDTTLEFSAFHRTRGNEGLRGPASTVSVRVKPPPRPFALGELEPASLTARCGEGARGTLSQGLPAGVCSEPAFTWQYRDGPALTEPTLSGQQVQVSTQQTEFGELIGRSVVLSVTADAGSGIAPTREHEVRITVQPFVEVRRRTEMPSNAESGLVGVSIDLRNTTACGVSDVIFRERIEGADVVADSARLDGVAVQDEVSGDELTVRGLTLAGNTTSRLTYVVRPRLFGEQRFAGQAFVRGELISTDPTESSGSCGCSGGGSGAVMLGLVGLVAVLRRRRVP